MKGCRFKISIYFAAMIGCLIVLDNTGIAVLALFCAAFHEAGHFAALFFLKVQIEEVDFKVIGINIRLSGKTRIGYKKEVIIAIAGSLANLLMCIVAYILYNFGINIVLMQNIFILSLMLCLFNALPIAPLDGGMMLEAFLCSRLPLNKALLITNIISAVFLFPLTIAGYYLVVITGYNYSLILACVYLVVSLVLKGRLFEIT